MSSPSTAPQHRPWLATYEALGRDWNQLPELPEKTVSDYVQEHAIHFSERAALVYQGETTTYSQLNHSANQLAGVLQQSGLKSGDVLAIQMPNTPQYVVAIIAAARLGMPITSISPLLTAREVIAQCNDATVKALLLLDGLFNAMGEALAEAVPTLQYMLVSSAADMLKTAMPHVPNTEIDAFNNTSSNVKALDFKTAMEANVHPNQLAKSEEVSLDEVLYLQYTGGTTGKAKGAQLTSRNLLINNLQANVFYGYALGEETVASAFPFFHIGGIAVLINALRTAATFLVIPDPRNLAQYCAQMELFPPTVLANVPALFQMLMTEERFRALDFSRLKMAISGAAPFAEEGIKQLEAIIGKGRYCEVYGMTETSPVQTLNPAERFKPGLVGIPLPGTDLKIVDAATGLTELPLGEPGEIIVAGPQVMQGYLGAPDATANSLREFKGKIWMYTGDIGFLDNEGYLKICDRSKDMLIVGGYKVFSVELESKLQEILFIAASAVIGKPDLERPGNEIVELYVQCKPGITLSEPHRRSAILKFSRENLAPYKAPKGIHFIDNIPLTSVGKIDKKALRELQQQKQHNQQNPLELA